MKNTILTFVIILTSATTSFSQTRVVLIEQFSNSSCPPCGAVSPSVYAFANNNQPDVAVIAYHTLFPYNNDSMYFENPTEATQRVNYYSVAGVPNSVLDGNVYNGSTNPFVTNISTLVGNRLNVAPRYDVIASNLVLNGNQLSGVVKFTSLNTLNVSENLIAHVVVVEKNVLKSSYAASPGANSETEYGYVMRKMVPNASGTSLVNTSLNGSDSIPINWTLNHIKNKAELRVVAFVQNASTKEVHQARLFAVSQAPVGLMEDVTSLRSALIYPNPSTGEFSISFKTQENLKSLMIFDPLGKVVFSENLGFTTYRTIRGINLGPGAYYVKIETSAGSEIQKLLITE
jgi:hypothetical protein